MKHVHIAKRRRLDENVEPCIRDTVKNSTMSISSLIDQKPHHHNIPPPTEHSNSCGSALHTPQPTQNLASSDSPAPFGLLEQSGSQVAQASETKCAVPARHSRPWEISNSHNSSPAPNSYTTVPSPNPDFSSDDDFLSLEDEGQDPNTHTVSQANTEQGVMVCFGMVS
ncbi:hypothetical protein M441DRAFT_299446 [Trichoderma asperellum CBS 433.97]|uniref:Uncharacterized protein n=1 Tax=Trichoderma asperellum (strain ATCC 204424 / CBS 433.97 / NBRC 101777) TaxID=1042311 RepID=A0A2T3ZJ26_TRIA4|nr:hypothetical protein M441DRAFT_299446 [Trichoderma asperellum CBS 433.97]PTB44818.1 hypothetical protein M441DRAFT_299446 [Trichoderma asperellum CBS 433.97]